MAIGNPFGLPHTATSGIVSGLKRSGFSPDDYENYIQTDASINPGNSGGALVDLHGGLVGINTAILSGSGDNIGIGFAIPVNTAQRVMHQLIEYGAVRRGQLGINVYAVTPAVAHSLGLHEPTGGLVGEVIPGSPAEKAGVRAGDVITGIAGRSVKSNADLRNAIGLLRVGDGVTINLLRDGRRQRRHAVIADSLPDAPAAARAPRRPGSHADMTSSLSVCVLGGTGFVGSEARQPPGAAGTLGAGPDPQLGPRPASASPLDRRARQRQRARPAHARPARHRNGRGDQSHRHPQPGRPRHLSLGTHRGSPQKSLPPRAARRSAGCCR